MGMVVVMRRLFQQTGRLTDGGLRRGVSTILLFLNPVPGY